MKFLILFFILIFFSGCLGDNISATIKEKPEFQTQKLILNTSTYFTKNNYLGTCLAFVCSNSSVPFPLSIFFDSSLKGGNCSLIPTNETHFTKLIKEESDKLYVKHFMFGMGHSFFSFSEANRYCKNSLKLAVKWLVGDRFNPYPIPSKERAECFLEKNVMPVYVLYSNFSNINISRAREIALALNNAGPVIIVSEADLVNNQTYIDKVKEQILALRQNCNKCLIALGVKFNGSNEYEVVKNLFSNNSIKEKVDLVAYGLNSYYWPNCNIYSLLWQAANFSKFLILNYSKPSLIYYVLLDENDNPFGKCKWDNVSIENAYSLLFFHSPMFSSYGVIGVSPYSMFGGGPLECRNCMLFSPNDHNNCSFYFSAQEIGQRALNFFGLCQAYYSSLEKKHHFSALIPLVFSNGSRACNFAENLQLRYYFDYTETHLKPIEFKNLTRENLYFSCSGCFFEEINTYLPTIQGNPTYCTLYYPYIEMAADRFDMDLTLLRAIVWQESSFQRCAVSFVPKSNRGCNPLNISVISDTSNCCPPHEKQRVDKNALNPITPCSSQGDGEECKPCAFGIAQTIDYPSYVYEHNKLEPPDSVKYCASYKDGKLDFNPFRPYDSSCSAAYKFVYQHLPVAKNLVEKNKDKLEITNENKRKWYEIFLALDLFYGHQAKSSLGNLSLQNWIDAFALQKDKTQDDCYNVSNKACCGNKDFINYVKYCLHNGGFSYAYDVLTKYKWLSLNCEDLACSTTENSAADKNIIGYLCKNDMGKIGNIDCCPYAKTIFGYSAYKLCKNENTPQECRKAFCK